MVSTPNQDRSVTGSREFVTAECGRMLRFLGWHLRLQTGLVGLSRLHPGAGQPGSAAKCARGAGGARRARLYSSCSLQGRLVRRSQKSTSIRARIVDELPLIVVVLLVI